ncbi:MAG TPA: GntR family transcriptional regulator, partial [Thermoleophilaceae bacterium]
YEVGRHTLRAAFGALVRRGLLVKEPNRGVFVRVLTADDLVEIYDFRTAIEAQVFRILAADGRVPDAAHIAVGRLSMLGPRSPRRKIVEADLAFHRALVAASGNSRLVGAHEQLDAEIVLCLAQLVRGYARPDELADEHGELIEAIQSRRASVAERAIRGHFERATAWLVAHADPR